MNWSVILSASAAMLNGLVAIVFGFALNAVWEQAHELGEISTQVSEIGARLTAIDDKLNGIETRLTKNETNPTELLERAGFRVNPDLFSVFIDGKNVTFP